MPFNPAPFFNILRDGLMGPTLEQSEVDGCNAILAAMEGVQRSHCAYALATAWHETAHSMKPVKEANWLSAAAANRYFFRMYDPQGQRPRVAAALGNTHAGDGVKFCGRGYVQITGRTNYAKAGAACGADLVNNPQQAMEPAIAATILRSGMTQGWFTTRSLGGMLPAGRDAARADFVAARRIINGQDKAGLIADYAMQFQAALAAGGW